MDCVLMETSAYKEMQAHLQRLLERVSALHSLSAQPTTVRWLTAEEVCKALSITKRALQYYRSAGIIPYTALGNKVLFRDDDIRQLLEKNLIKTGVDTLCMHADAIKPGQRVLIVDDLLATGGTVKATIEMIERLGGVVAGCAFLIELDGLDGRKAIEGYDTKVLMNFPG